MPMLYPLQCCFQRLGLKNLELRINSVGCPKCRKNWPKAREF